MTTKTTLLPPDHPIRAYLPDAEAMASLLLEEPSLMTCDELRFLRRLLFAASAVSPTGDDDDDDDEDGGSHLGGREEPRPARRGEAEEAAPDSESDGRGPRARSKIPTAAAPNGASNGRGDDDDDDGDGSSSSSDREGGAEAGYWDDDSNPFGYSSAGSEAPGANPELGGAGVPSGMTRDGEDDDDDVVVTYDVIVVGAGPAGLGASIALLAGGLRRSSLLILERDRVGGSFERWNANTRFVSPSWPSNPFGPIDLNSVEPFSSVAIADICGDDRAADGDRDGDGRGSDAPKEDGGDSGGDGEEMPGEAERSRSENGGDGDGGGDSNRRNPFDGSDDWQHPSGAQYARYLRRVASRWKLPIRERCDVASIDRVPGTEAWPAGGFEIGVKAGSGNGARDESLYSRYVVWCGGEWAYPSIPKAVPNPSAVRFVRGPANRFEAGSFVHYAQIGPSKDAWTEMSRRALSNPVPIADGRASSSSMPERSDETRATGGVGVVVVVGAYEAGVDAACSLLDAGAVNVVLVDSEERIGGWGTARGGPTTAVDPDPSASLSPNSIRRLRAARRSGRLTLLPSRTCVGAVASSIAGSRRGYEASLRVENDARRGGDVESLRASVPLVLCTGFDASRSGVLQSLVDWRTDDNCPIVSRSCDESLKTPGLFVCGPMLRHVVGAKETTSERARCNGPASDGIHPTQSSMCPSDELLSEPRNEPVAADEDFAEDEKKDKASTTTKRTVIFCFIYKFRTRFALVAGEILSRLVYDDHCSAENGESDGIAIDEVGNERLSRLEGMMKLYRERGMLLSDLECAALSCTAAATGGAEKGQRRC